MSADVYAALAAVNAEVVNPHKDGRGNYGTYLTLDSLLDYVRPIYARHGLSVMQDVTTDPDTDALSVRTIIAHMSGESVTFGPVTGPAGPSWQTLGGAVSYARRYALLAALGIAGGDDDDAQEHTDTTPARRGNRSQRKPTPKQREYLDRLIDQTGAALDHHAWVESARKILGGMADGWDGNNDTLDFDQVSALIEALKGYQKAEKKATRTNASNQPPDPWADAPLVDPLTGEIVT